MLPSVLICGICASCYILHLVHLKIVCRGIDLKVAHARDMCL